MSLRWKISLLIVASVIIAVLSCSIILRQSAARAEDDRMRSTVTDQLANAVNIFSETGVLTLNARIDDPQLPADARAQALKGQSVTIRSEVDGEEIVWAAAPIEVGTYTEVISVRASTADSRELIGRIDQALLVGMIGSASSSAASVRSSPVASRADSPSVRRRPGRSPPVTPRSGSPTSSTNRIRRCGRSPRRSTPR